LVIINYLIKNLLLILIIENGCTYSSLFTFKYVTLAEQK